MRTICFAATPGSLPRTTRTTLSEGMPSVFRPPVAQHQASKVLGRESERIGENRKESERIEVLGSFRLHVFRMFRMFRMFRF